MRQIQETERCIQGKPDGKIPLRRPKHSWEDNIKTDYVEMRWKGMD
jgi:hypothetical protein